MRKNLPLVGAFVAILSLAGVAGCESGGSNNSDENDVPYIHNVVRTDTFGVMDNHAPDLRASVPYPHGSIPLDRVGCNWEYAQFRVPQRALSRNGLLHVVIEDGENRVNDELYVWDRALHLDRDSYEAARALSPKGLSINGEEVKR